MTHLFQVPKFASKYQLCLYARKYQRDKYPTGSSNQNFGWCNLRIIYANIPSDEFRSSNDWVYRSLNAYKRNGINHTESWLQFH